MQQSNQEPYPYQTDQVDLRKLFNYIEVRKLFIFSLTGFVTLLAMIYVFTISPTYKATTSFTLPSDSSIMNINKLKLSNESKESVFTNYLAFLSSQEIQRKVFDDGGYLTALNLEIEPIDNVTEYTTSFLSSIIVEAPVTKISKNKKVGGLIEKPYMISMEGSDAKVISRFLNELVARANQENISTISDIINQKLRMRLHDISIERGLLIDQAQRERLSQIIRIKEQDAQKIREINDKIDRVKSRVRENRFNEIIVLSNAAKLAKSLGIIENNLHQISPSVQESKLDLRISLIPEKNLPEWYIYGEKALLERVALLKMRTNDDPFTPELVSLNNQLREIQNNNLLKTLETRKNDSPFIAAIVILDIEQIKLESSILDMTGSSSMQLTRSASAKLIEQNNNTIVLLALISSFMMSIFLALVMGAIKQDEERST